MKCALPFVVSSIAALAGPAPAGPSEGPIVARSQRVAPSQPTASSRFGEVLALDGEVLVVGSLEGAVYVYERVLDAWQETARLTPSDPSGLFGQAVDVDAAAETIVVGGAFDTGAFQLEATAWIYEKVAGAWTQTGRVSVEGSDALFGEAVSVAVSGDRVVVGGGFDADLLDRGQADVFVRSTGGWLHGCRLVPPASQDDDHFGWSVDIDGDSVVVGAYGVEGVSGNSGAAFTFDLSGGCAVGTFLLGPHANAGNQSFGWDVALDGDRLVVASRANVASPGASGAVVTYTRQAGPWVESGQTVTPDASGDDGFGFAVDLHGDTLVVGAPMGDGPGGDEGVGYLYSWDGLEWCGGTPVSIADGVAGMRFGNSVGVAAGRVVAGSFSGGAPAGAGLVHAFESGPDVGDSYCVGAVNTTGQAARIGGFGSSNVAEDDFHLVATQAPANRLGMFFFGPLQVQAPLDNGFRCVGGMTQRLFPLRTTDAGGSLHRRLDLTSGPALGAITNAVPVTMNFQFWYRDGGSSNLTDGLEVAFQ